MHIFYALGSFYPAQTGGADNSTYWMAQALNQRGVRVSVATTNSGLTAGQVTFDRWLPTSFGEVVYARTLIHYLPLKLLWFSVRRALKADVVHLNNLFYPSSLVLGLLCSLLGKRIVWSIHGELAPIALSQGTAQKKVFLSLIRLLAPHVTFHVTGNLEENYLKHTFGPTVRYCRIPLYMELPAQQPRQPGPPYLLFVGRIDPIKALDNLLRAAAQSAAFQQGGYQLWLVGKGKPAYEQELANLVQELGLTNRVQFLGFRDGIEKYQLMANAQATLLPSHTENFSVIVVESLAQGTPVLASVYTPWAMLPTEGVGWQTDNRPEPLAQAIDQVIHTPPDHYATMRQRAYAVAHTHFDVHKHIGEWLTCYTQPLT